MPVVSEKKRIFLKKVNKLFASSDFVVTFASAFEKCAVLIQTSVRKNIEKIGRDRFREMQGFREAESSVELFGLHEATKRGRKSKVLKKMFGGLKKMFYLCSPFALQSATFSTRFFELLVLFERKEM